MNNKPISKETLINTLLQNFQTDSTMKYGKKF
jgi:hypothetical protein